MLRQHGTVADEWPTARNVKRDMNDTSSGPVRAQNHNSAASSAETRQENARIGRFGLDPNGLVVWVDAMFTAITGVAEDQIKGRSPRLLMAQALPGGTLQDLRGAAARGEVWRRRMVMVRADGGGADTLVTVVPNRAAGSGCSVLLEDWSHLDMSQEATRTIRRRRAHEILSAGLADDILNVLTQVLGEVEEVRVHAADHPSCVQSLDMIEHAVRRIEWLARDLSYLPHGAQQTAEVTDLNDVAREVARRVRAAMDRPELLHQTLSAQPVPVRASGHVMRKIVLNLCRAFLERGANTDSDLRIRTSIQREDDAEGLAFARLSVDWLQPLAPGEAPVRQLDAYAPFAEGEAAKTLALGLVSRMSSELGGVAVVEQDETGALTYVVTLPLAEADAAVAPVPELAADAPAEPFPPANADATPAQQVAVVVDDEPDVLHFMTKLLTRNGMEVRAFDTPVEAWAYLSASVADVTVLISDISMPEISGMELARRARGLRPDLPILLVSGRHYDLGVLPDGSAPAFLAKPFLPQDLTKAVSTLAG